MNDADKGISLLLAVLITSAALAVAIGIFGLMFGQVRISQSAHDSHVALYSADAGRECALYYAWRAASTNFWSGPICDGQLQDPGNLTGDCSITCAGFTSSFPAPSYLSLVQHNCNPSPCSGDPDVDEHIFKFHLQVAPTPSTPGICSDVKVSSKKFICFGSNNYTRTLIESDGQSSCTPNTSKVDRTLKVAVRNTVSADIRNICPDDNL